jgi:four helix bundle protein
MKDFRDLKVWQAAHQITLTVYCCTRDFPRQETYGIVSQLRRCSASVAANIAEGCGRSGNAEFGRFLIVAMGSASEVEYFLLLARDLKYLTPEQHASGCTRSPYYASNAEPLVIQSTERSGKCGAKSLREPS